MKRRLSAIMFAVAISAILNASVTYGQSSQTIRAEVPFAFSASSKTLPAGTYSIESAGDSRGVWRIRSKQQLGGFLLALTRGGHSDGNLVMTFHRYGDSYFLAGFKTRSYEIRLPASRGEKTRRRMLGPMAQLKVIDIETAGGGLR